MKKSSNSNLLFVLFFGAFVVTVSIFIKYGGTMPNHLEYNTISDSLDVKNIKVDSRLIKEFHFQSTGIDFINLLSFLHKTHPEIELISIQRETNTSQDTKGYKVSLKNKNYSNY